MVKLVTGLRRAGASGLHPLMAVRRAGLPLTAPSVPLFAIAVVLAVLAALAQYGGMSIPFISAHAFDTLAVAFAVLTVGVLARGA